MFVIGRGELLRLFNHIYETFTYPIEISLYTMESPMLRKCVTLYTARLRVTPFNNRTSRAYCRTLAVQVLIFNGVAQLLLCHLLDF